jgi:MoxR-like ATPase
LRVGVSPRGAIGLFRAARAYALVQGRRYLVPDDVQTLVAPCLAHRLLPIGASAATSEAHDQGAAILEELIAEIPVPV